MAKLTGMNTFSNNMRGGVDSYNSTLTLMGTTTFMSNSAEYGGGVWAVDSNIYCSCTTTFVDNIALLSGGAVYME